MYAEMPEESKKLFEAGTVGNKALAGKYCNRCLQQE